MQTDNTVLQQRFYLLPLSMEGQEGEPLYCLFTQNQVVEVLGQKTVYPVPFSPGYVQGLILSHGNLVPVIDADALYDGADKKAELQARQLLIIRTGQIDAASGDYLKLALVCMSTILTFKLSGRDGFQAVTAEQAPAAFAAQCLVRGFFRLRGYRVVVLDFDAIALGTYDSKDAATGKNEPFVW